MLGNPNTILTVYIAVVLILAAAVVLGFGSYLSVSVNQANQNSGPSCGEICADSCQGFDNSQDAEQCLIECNGLCAGSIDQLQPNKSNRAAPARGEED